MFELGSFSQKQLKVLSWWCGTSPHKAKNGVICDGAVRSGKTLAMSLGFTLWAMSSFQNQHFALCGKTITSLRRNVLNPLLETLSGLGFGVRQKLSENRIELAFKNIKNVFYVFGGKDEASASLIQGMTLAGILLDEVALMPRSFVEQAVARCSVRGSKFWFNCNPEHPNHWFYKEWILKSREKNILRIPFSMLDNPSLDESIIKRYESIYTGTFYDRFVLGKWTAAEGLVYPQMTEKSAVFDVPDTPFDTYWISCDYGTVNPSSFGLWGGIGGTYYRIGEYYYDSRKTGIRRTDEQHYAALCELAGDREITSVVCDPSAASFIEVIKKYGRFNVIAAQNDVIGGIRKVSDALRLQVIRICKNCQAALAEFSMYRWDEKSGRDVPKKEFDHAMDDIRYFVSTIALKSGDGGFFAVSALRGGL